MYRTKEAVIIAAGQGSRILEDINVSHKCLIPLLNRRLIEYIVDNLTNSGIELINIITGFNSDKLEKSIKEIQFQANINLLRNDEWEKGNGTSVFYSSKAVKASAFLLTMADHWFTEEMTQLINNKNISFSNILAVDTLIENINDVQDATKVQIGKNNKIINIHKKLVRYNAIDCGIFRFNSDDIYSSLEKSFSKNNFSLSGGIRDLIKNNNMHYIDVEKRLWQDTDTTSDLEVAIEKLRQYMEKKS